ncbi:MAG: SLAP domain-containing protein [Lactobacillus sp.]|nr:SLAP domain-containing protein [Lactobacillus sp.]
MKKSKKLIVSLAAVALATVPVITTSLNQAHAAQTIDQTKNKIATDGTLTLNHNTRIYNQRGQKLYSYQGSNGLLKKGATVKYADQVKAITNPDTKRYSFHKENFQDWFYLPYKTIKGQEYYSIGHGGYIKAANVQEIDSYSLYTNYATVRLAKITESGVGRSNNARIINSQGNFTNKYIKKDSKIVIDRTSDRVSLAGSMDILGLSNSYMEVFRLKNNKQQFVLRADIKKSSIPRQVILPYSNFTSVRIIRKSPIYNIHGIQDSDSAFPTIAEGHETDVKSLRYIWVPSLNKAELFYEGTEFYKDAEFKYIKASDVEYLFGKHLTPVNTATDVTPINTAVDVTPKKNDFDKSSL